MLKIYTINCLHIMLIPKSLYSQLLKDSHEKLWKNKEI